MLFSFLLFHCALLDVSKVSLLYNCGGIFWGALNFVFSSKWLLRVHIYKCVGFYFHQWYRVYKFITGWHECSYSMLSRPMDPTKISVPWINVWLNSTWITSVCRVICTAGDCRFLLVGKSHAEFGNHVYTKVFMKHLNGLQYLWFFICILLLDCL